VNYSQQILLYFLGSMVKACDRIFLHTSRMTFEQFASDSKTLDAVERQFQILGECSRKIPYSVQNKFKQVPWSSMYRLRNRIAHEFYDVDPEMLWHIIQNDLVKNHEDLKQIVNKPPAPKLVTKR